MSNQAGWMLFVDGENFAIRAQELAKREELALSVDQTNYMQDVFVWLPGWDPLTTPFQHRIFPLDNAHAVRAYYYTSVAGDDVKVLEVKRALRALNFDHQVFKKVRGSKSKGVDISLTKDMLSHAFLDHYEDAILIAGDGDYAPLVNEVKRRGKRVYLWFFAGDVLGTAGDLALIADLFVDMTPHFIETWRRRLTRVAPA